MILLLFIVHNWHAGGREKPKKDKNGTEKCRKSKKTNIMRVSLMKIN
jgi:hypothetical protein